MQVNSVEWDFVTIRTLNISKHSMCLFASTEPNHQSVYGKVKVGTFQGVYGYNVEKWDSDSDNFEILLGCFFI